MRFAQVAGVGLGSSVGILRNYMVRVSPRAIGCGRAETVIANVLEVFAITHRPSVQVSTRGT